MGLKETIQIPIEFKIDMAQLKAQIKEAASMMKAEFSAKQKLPGSKARGSSKSGTDPNSLGLPGTFNTGKSAEQASSMLEDSARNLKQAGTDLKAAAKTQQQSAKIAKDQQKMRTDVQAGPRSVQQGAPQTFIPRGPDAPRGDRRGAMNRLASVAEYRVLSGVSNLAFGALGRGVGIAADVNNELSQLNKVLNTTKSNLDSLKTSAIATSKELGLSTVEVLKGFRIFAQQGLPTEDVKRFGRTVAMASNVSSFGTEGLAELITAARQSFPEQQVGKSGEKLIDTLLKVEGKFAVTETDLAEVIKRIGPQAAVAGMSIAELSAVTTIMKERTRASGGEIATSLRFIIRNLQDRRSITKLQKGFEQFGEGQVQFTDATGDLRSTFDILQDISKVFPKLNRAQKMFVAQQIGETRFAPRVLALLDGFGKTQDVLSEASTAQGTTLERNRIVMESIAKQAGLVKSAFDAAALSMSANLIDPAVTFLRVLQKTLNAVEAISNVGSRKESAVNLSTGRDDSTRGLGGTVGSFAAYYGVLKTADHIMRSFIKDSPGLMGPTPSPKPGAAIKPGVISKIGEAFSKAMVGFSGAGSVRASIASQVSTGVAKGMSISKPIAGIQTSLQLIPKEIQAQQMQMKLPPKLVGRFSSFQELAQALKPTPNLYKTAAVGAAAFTAATSTVMGVRGQQELGLSKSAQKLLPFGKSAAQGVGDLPKVGRAALVAIKGLDGLSRASAGLIAGFLALSKGGIVLLKNLFTGRFFADMMKKLGESLVGRAGAGSLSKAAGSLMLGSGGSFAALAMSMVATDLMIKGIGRVFESGRGRSERQGLVSRARENERSISTMRILSDSMENLSKLDEDIEKASTMSLADQRKAVVSGELPAVLTEMQDQRDRTQKDITKGIRDLAFSVKNTPALQQDRFEITPTGDVRVFRDKESRERVKDLEIAARSIRDVGKRDEAIAAIDQAREESSYLLSEANQEQFDEVSKVITNFSELNRSISETAIALNSFIESLKGDEEFTDFTEAEDLARKRAVARGSSGIDAGMDDITRQIGLGFTRTLPGMSSRQLDILQPSNREALGLEKTTPVLQHVDRILDASSDFNEFITSLGEAFSKARPKDREALLGLLDFEDSLKVRGKEASKELYNVFSDPLFKDSFPRPAFSTMPTSTSDFRELAAGTPEVTAFLLAKTLPRIMEAEFNRQRTKEVSGSENIEKATELLKQGQLIKFTLDNKDVSEIGRVVEEGNEKYIQTVSKDETGALSIARTLVQQITKSITSIVIPDVVTVGIAGRSDINERSILKGIGAGALEQPSFQPGAAFLNELDDQLSGLLTGFGERGQAQFNVNIQERFKTIQDELGEILKKGGEVAEGDPERLVRAEGASLLAGTIKDLGSVIKSLEGAFLKYQQFENRRQAQREISVTQTGPLTMFGGEAPKVELGKDLIDLGAYERATLALPNLFEGLEGDQVQLKVLQDSLLDFKNAADTIEARIRSTSDKGLSVLDLEAFQNLLKSPVLHEASKLEIGDIVRSVDDPSFNVDRDIESIIGRFKSVVQNIGPKNIAEMSRPLQEQSKMREEAAKSAVAMAQLQINAEAAARALGQMKSLDGLFDNLRAARGEGPTGVLGEKQPIYFKGATFEKSTQLDFRSGNQFDMERRLINELSSPAARRGRGGIFDEQGQRMTPISRKEAENRLRVLNIREQSALREEDNQKRRDRLTTAQSQLTSMASAIDTTLSTRGDMDEASKTRLLSIRKEIEAFSKMSPRSFVDSMGRAKPERLEKFINDLPQKFAQGLPPDLAEKVNAERAKQEFMTKVQDMMVSSNTVNISTNDLNIAGARVSQTTTPATTPTTQQADSATNTKQAEVRLETVAQEAKQAVVTSENAAKSSTIKLASEKNPEKVLQAQAAIQDTKSDVDKQELYKSKSPIITSLEDIKKLRETAFNLKPGVHDLKPEERKTPIITKPKISKGNLFDLPLEEVLDIDINPYGPDYANERMKQAERENQKDANVYRDVLTDKDVLTKPTTYSKALELSNFEERRRLTDPNELIFEEDYIPALGSRSTPRSLAPSISKGYNRHPGLDRIRYDELEGQDLRSPEYYAPIPKPSRQIDRFLDSGSAEDRLNLQNADKNMVPLFTNLLDSGKDQPQLSGFNEKGSITGSKDQGSVNVDSNSAEEAGAKVGSGFLDAAKQAAELLFSKIVEGAKILAQASKEGASMSGKTAETSDITTMLSTFLEDQNTREALIDNRLGEVGILIKDLEQKYKQLGENQRQFSSDTLGTPYGMAGRSQFGMSGRSDFGMSGRSQFSMGGERDDTIRMLKAARAELSNIQKEANQKDSQNSTSQAAILSRISSLESNINNVQSELNVSRKGSKF